MPEYGQILGSAVDLGFDDKINDLRYHQLENRRALAQAEAKAKMFADDLDYQNAANSYDNPIIKEFAKNKFKEIGAYARNNPDYLYNPDKLAQINAMRRELRDNEHINRGLASDTAYKAYLKDLQEVSKNPNQHDTEAYQDIQNQWNNYLQHGNQDGVDAANKYGAKAFVYTKPKDFIDVNKSFKDIGDSFDDMLAPPIKGFGRDSYQEISNPVTLKANAEQLYSQNKRQFDILAKEKGIDPIKFIMTGIDAFVKKKRDFGDQSLNKELAILKYKDKLDRIAKGEESPSADSYQIDIVKKNHSYVHPDQMSELVSSSSPAFLIDKNSNKKIDLTGSVTPKPTGYNFYPDPEGKDVHLRGKKYAESFAYVSPEKAIDLGILDEDGDIKNEWKGSVKVETREDDNGTVLDKNKKPTKVYKLSLVQPFDVNVSSNAGKFNSKSMTAKQRPLPKENYQKTTSFPKGSQVDEAGNVFLDGKYIGKM